MPMTYERAKELLLKYENTNHTAVYLEAQRFLEGWEAGLEKGINDAATVCNDGTDSGEFYARQVIALHLIPQAVNPPKEAE